MIVLNITLTLDWSSGYPNGLQDVKIQELTLTSGNTDNQFLKRFLTQSHLFQSVMSMSSESGPSMASSGSVELLSYQDALESVLTWLLEAEEAMDKQPPIADSVHIVKDQFNLHEVWPIKFQHCQFLTFYELLIPDKKRGSVIFLNFLLIFDRKRRLFFGFCFGKAAAGVTAVLPSPSCHARQGRKIPLLFFHIK